MGETEAAIRHLRGRMERADGYRESRPRWNNDDIVAAHALISAADTRALDDEIAVLTAEIAALGAALGAFVANEWDGWFMDDWTGNWRCTHCRAEGEEVNSSPPPHEDDCPIVLARAALARGTTGPGEGR